MESIFRDNVKSLFSPGFRIVFTIPIAAVRKPAIQGALNSAGIVRPRRFPVAKFFGRDDRHNANAEPDALTMETFTTLLKKRIPDELLAPETARQIVLMSGGVVREIVRLARECCLECMVKLGSVPDDEAVIIDNGILETALRGLRNDFARQIGSDWYQLLVTVYKTAETPDAHNKGFFRTP